ncbi:S41 family peptidase [Flavobacterium artemisiae]|uniref:S41 family peptidase n=1 Tax=Flavobacterium artemisiae TaxID=2126556 RepID=A0ABW4HD84_9FLAO
MQKIILILVIIFTQILFGQSKITETEKLTATCKVWGFLKYYHPKVAAGEFNWDQQLIDILPKIEKAKTRKEYSLVISNWIDSLGEVPLIAPVAAPKDVVFFDKNFDLSWINLNALFSRNLSAKLKFIEENRYQTEQEFDPDFDSFKNLKNYFDIDYTDKNNRIRMIFAYWNVIEYFFPYKYLMDQKWDLSLEQIIPAVVEAKTEDDFYNAFINLTTKLNDSHVEFAMYNNSIFNDKIKSFPGRGKIIDEKLVITEITGDSLAQANNVKVGDVITKINHKTIKELIALRRDAISASNESKYLDKLASRILMSYSDKVDVEFLEDGKYTTKSMTWMVHHESHRNEYKKGAQKKKEKFKLLDNNVGYVDMGVIKQRHIPDMIETLKSTKAIVFDMRNYPNGTYEDISNFLNPKEATFAIYTYPYLNYPGRFYWTKGTSTGKDNKDNYKGKVIVLLNEKSLSQAEWTAMCFQTAGNTTIIGSQTAGTDGNVIELDFKHFHTRYSGIGVYYPDKRETQRIGIVPDIEIKPTIKGIQEGRDEVLERALKFIEMGV